MDLFRIIFVSLLTWSCILAAKKSGNKFHGNFWQTLAPGELLNELDLMTIDELLDRAYVRPVKKIKTTTKPAKKHERTKKLKKTKPVRRIIESNDGSAASTSTSVEHDDYDRAHEEFVKRYFNDAADHYLADDVDADVTSENLSQDVSILSGSIESDIIAPLDAQPFDTSPKASTKNKKKQNCRKVRKNGEICLICKNPRNDEHSETCSYEHSSEPETYSYETQRKFRESRNSDDDDTDNVGAENDSAELAAESNAVPQLTSFDETISNETFLNGSCIQRATGSKVCFYCRNKLGKLQVSCSDSKPADFLEPMKKKPLNENLHKQRRIFKRTLSYVFEKGQDSNGTLSLPVELAQNSTESLK